MKNISSTSVVTVDQNGNPVIVTTSPIDVNSLISELASLQAQVASITDRLQAIGALPNISPATATQIQNVNQAQPLNSNQINI